MLIDFILKLWVDNKFAHAFDVCDRYLRGKIILPKNRVIYSLSFAQNCGKLC